MFLLRDLASARTWLALCSVVAGCVTGFVSFFVAVIGLICGVPHWRTIKSRSAWGEFGYAVLRFPLSVAGACAGVCAWALGLAMVTLPLYDRSLPRGGAVIDSHVFTGVSAMTLSVVLGALVLVTAPQIARGLAAADIAVAKHLLGPPGDLAARVSDDGIGGADPAGAGLTGLADRVAGVDGKLTVESPSGGPTIIAAELPCG